LRNGVVDRLFERVMLFWTGLPRDAGTVLREQRANTVDRRATLHEMREHALCIQSILTAPEPDLTKVGQTIHESWLKKRGLASTITTSDIDVWYQEAMTAGADGGKVAGAGGGGFLMFLVPPECRTAVRESLSELVEVPIRHEVHGSQVAMPFMRW
jgi:D-glycero-alpha-D-manno-heptose-7-phosphate kinase